MRVRVIATLLLAAGSAAVAGPAHAEERCFGAAARNPERRCENPRLRLRVTPTPAEARDGRNAPCSFIEQHGLIHVCQAGVAPAEAQEIVMLIGDSHAAHWRAAFESVAQARKWRVLSMIRSGCPLSKALRALTPADRRAQCSQWKREVFAWFGRHPEVRTVFVSGLTGGTGVVPTRGRSEFATSVAGYRSAWRALPASVRRVVVVRDNPKMRSSTAACVTRAIAARREPGRGCAVPLRAALQPDPMAVAAERMRSRRVRAVDLTRFFCDRRHCFPVVGGALTLKDTTHITAVFSRSLGPFLRRAVDRVLPG